jgi:hypothetical protein
VEKKIDICHFIFVISIQKNDTAIGKLMENTTFNFKLNNLKRVLWSGRMELQLNLPHFKGRGNWTS